MDKGVVTSPAEEPEEEFGNLYLVERPDDGAKVPLTCTKKQLQTWLDKGYKLVDSAVS